MKEIKLVDTTFRDGNQSLWGAMGMSTKKILSIGSRIDEVGFKTIDFMSSIHMGVYVRYHKENPWEAIRLCSQAIRRTPLTFGTTGRRFIGFNRLPESMMELVMERIAANGIRRVWLVEASHEIDLMLKVGEMCKKVGIEEYVCALSYTISPVHTDEFYVGIATELASSPFVDTLFIKDQGGLLTPERVRTLVPAIKKAINGKPLELHSHSSTGLASICYLEAIQLGVDILHTAIPPLAEGTSLPSVFSLLENLQHLSLLDTTNQGTIRALPSWARTNEQCCANVDLSALEDIAVYLRKVADDENLPIGCPAEHKIYYYQHQIPGGMMTTLKRQLAEMKMENRFDEVVEEVIRVRAELGYPIMVTPLSQFVGTQATMNVINNERYKIVPEGIIQYAAGWFGKPPRQMFPDVLEKIANHPLAKKIFNVQFPQPSVKEIRNNMNIGKNVSDEEFLLRYVMIGKEVDEIFDR